MKPNAFSISYKFVFVSRVIQTQFYSSCAACAIFCSWDPLLICLSSAAHAEILLLMILQQSFLPYWSGHLWVVEYVLFLMFFLTSGQNFP